MKFGYSTLGKPDLSLEEARRLAERWNLDSIEVRSLESRLDLPDYFQSHCHEDFSRGSIQISLLGTSLKLAQPTERDLAEFRAFIHLAKRLACPLLRVFGGGDWLHPATAELVEIAARTVATCREWIDESESDVQILLETHGGFCHSQSCVDLNARIDKPVLILWDSHHTWRRAREPLDETWKRIGHWIRQVHYKDSVDEEEGGSSRYVLPGLGTFPTHELLALLRSAHFSGTLTLEWEAYWHPELPDLSLALHAFSKIIGRFTE